mmetsp:Transcript_19340/g.58136  ORF Transcript_19340/g.58136 Transcript_19340/m.58136 type:complete len:326 (-) Transcript_19340:56-1033(-)
MQSSAVRRSQRRRAQPQLCADHQAPPRHQSPRLSPAQLRVAEASGARRTAHLARVPPPRGTAAPSQAQAPPCRAGRGAGTGLRRPRLRTCHLAAVPRRVLEPRQRMQSSRAPQRWSRAAFWCRPPPRSRRSCMSSCWSACRTPSLSAPSRLPFVDTAPCTTHCEPACKKSMGGWRLSSGISGTVHSGRACRRYSSRVSTAVSRVATALSWAWPPTSPRTRPTPTASATAPEAATAAPRYSSWLGSWWEATARAPAQTLSHRSRMRRRRSGLTPRSIMRSNRGSLQCSATSRQCLSFLWSFAHDGAASGWRGRLHSSTVLGLCRCE